MIRLFGGGGGGLPPGVAGDGADGLIVADKVTAGSATADDGHTFHGWVTVLGNQAGYTNGEEQLTAYQVGTAPGGIGLGVGAFRGTPFTGQSRWSPLAVFTDSSGADDTNGTALLQLESSVAAGPNGYWDKVAFRVGYKGGIALFGKDSVPTAPRALAQATITAITDANAKAAVQALANTLADMGALTIT